MFSRVYDAMFGCRHSRYSFPITIRSRRMATGSRAGTYVVCLDCGKELAYDWNAMKIVNEQSKQAARSLVTKEAA